MESRWQQNKRSLINKELKQFLAKVERDVKNSLIAFIKVNGHNIEQLAKSDTNNDDKNLVNLANRIKN